MSKTETLVLSIIARTCDMDVAELSLETKLIDDLGFDSIKALELLLDIEKAFAIEIDENDVVGIDSVEHIIRLIEASESTHKMVT